MKSMLHGASVIGIAAMSLGLWTVTVSPTFADTSADAAPVASSWQRHEVNFDYYGITSLYTCDGLEGHVKSILLHFGARKDALVRAIGCARGPDVPSHNAMVRAVFYTLAPAAGSSTDIVQAKWVPVLMTPQKPFFMGDGDCELVNQLKDVLSKNFTLRDVSYRTDCVPHELTLNGFSVKAEALQIVAVPKTAAAH
jgi:hypothetical protein